MSSAIQQVVSEQSETLNEFVKEETQKVAAMVTSSPFTVGASGNFCEGRWACVSHQCRFFSADIFRCLRTPTPLELEWNRWW